jgi:hypothetical protein
MSETRDSLFREALQIVRELKVLMKNESKDPITPAKEEIGSLSDDQATHGGVEDRR